jgi:hypothetical protein
MATKNRALATLAGYAPTKGRILVGDGTDWNVLPIGTDDYVLEADSSESLGVKWAESQSVGIGQSWDDYSGSRDPSTSSSSPENVYQNSTGKPIMVAIWDTTNAATMSLYTWADGGTPLEIASMKHASSNANVTGSVSLLQAVIPDGNYYFVIASGSVVDGWAELR